MYKVISKCATSDFLRISGRKYLDQLLHNLHIWVILKEVSTAPLSLSDKVVKCRGVGGGGGLTLIVR